jgi:arylsulfatase
MRWNGQIPPATVCSEVVSSMDLLPTIARLVDFTLPPDRTMDGRDIWSLICGTPNAKSPHEAFYFYAGTELQAVRADDYKLHFAHRYLTTAAEPGRGGRPSNHGQLKPMSITSSGLEGIASRHGYRVVETPKALFHLPSDPSESKNLIAEHPDIAARLEGLADAMRKDLGDSLTGSQGDRIRPRATIFDISDPRLLIPRAPSRGVQPDLIRNPKRRRANDKG